MAGSCGGCVAVQNSTKTRPSGELNHPSDSHPSMTRASAIPLRANSSTLGAGCTGVAGSFGVRMAWNARRCVEMGVGVGSTDAARIMQEASAKRSSSLKDGWYTTTGKSFASKSSSRKVPLPSTRCSCTNPSKMISASCTLTCFMPHCSSKNELLSGSCSSFRTVWNAICFKVLVEQTQNQRV